MTKRDIYQLAQSSYIDNQLDEKKATKIAGLLRRTLLKAYIRALRLCEKERNVVIALPSTKIYNKSAFEKKFAGKKINVIENPALLLGFEITDNDIVYQMNLHGRIETEKVHIQEAYE